MREHTSEPTGILSSPDSSAVPLAMCGAFALTAGLAAYLVSPVRRSSTPNRQRRAFIAYLQDHLSGADMAIKVVHRLGSPARSADDGSLFRRLSKEFEEDRAVVTLLLMRSGAAGRSAKRMASYASGAALSVIAGGQPGDLSLFRTLEALSIGVQGKRCLWRALQTLTRSPIVHGINFLELEAKAVNQWEAIEKRRSILVTQTFCATVPGDSGPTRRGPTSRSRR